MTLCYLERKINALLKFQPYLVSTFIVNKKIKARQSIYTVPIREKITGAYLIDYKQRSRHTVVCCAAQEASAPHREYIDRKKEMRFSPLCSSVILHPIGTRFAAEVPTR